MLSGDPESIRPRQLAPLGLLAAVTAAPFSRPARRGVLLYGGVLGAASVRGGWRLAPVLATMHLTWSAGVVRGLVRLTLARARRAGAPG